MTGSIGDLAAFGFFSVLAICLTVCVLDSRRRREREELRKAALSSSQQVAPKTNE